MGVQLLFTVETNKKCDSDWIYIKSTIEHFYIVDNSHVKLNHQYMDGKGNYKNIKNKINKEIDKYSKASDNNKTYVIYCFDCDEYDINQKEKNFLEEAKIYCEKNSYDFVWFSKDIEQVYLGERIDYSEKKSRAVAFMKKDAIKHIDTRTLNQKQYKTGTSNLITILDNYLDRKE